jgi:ribosomal protein L22
MGYTFEPEQKHAKACATNVRISTKNAEIVCRVVRRKKLTVAKRLLEGLVARTRSLDGKYYTNAAEELLSLLNSCEKNADNRGLDKGKLFVYTSASEGSHMRRGRRKGSFGSRMKMTNLEVILVERK